ncbi:hypothetical protein RJ639_046878, partial [Escallonia herrerae]
MENEWVRDEDVIRSDPPRCRDKLLSTIVSYIPTPKHFSLLIINTYENSPELCAFSKRTGADDIHSFYRQGRVKLPLLRQPPEELEELLEQAKFIESVVAYNSMFAFTSLRGKIDIMVNNGKGPYIFLLGGQNHHRIGSLLPPEGQLPKFAQLYIYDSQNEVANRMAAFSKDNGSSTLDANIVEKLDRIFDINNEINIMYGMAVFGSQGNRGMLIQHQNMRLQQNLPEGDRTKSLKKFSQWIMDLGNGDLPTYNLESETDPAWIIVPSEFLIQSVSDPVQDIVNATYPNFAESGIPDHELELKVGSVMMLLRNTKLCQAKVGSICFFLLARDVPVYIIYFLLASNAVNAKPFWRAAFNFDKFPCVHGHIHL